MVSAAWISTAAIPLCKFVFVCEFFTLYVKIFSQEEREGIA